MSLSHPVKPMDVKHAQGLDTRWRRWLQNPYNIFQPYIKEGMKVMDFGCGSGFATEDLLKLVGPTGKVSAVDCQREMLEITKRKVSAPNLNFIQYHAGKGVVSQEELGSYDLVIAFYVMHEVEELGKALADLRAALKPGGQLIMIEFSFDRRFESYLDTAITQGFHVRKGPRVFLSRTASLPVPEISPSFWQV
ncbi:class I SAM-dependent methyltransferase [Vibrio sonorensis]|uniref:class I SAM-dependent methyltransferase n=1 Tax=Vibrio sonorensis TaxID=1004316 RepID=UPI0008D8DC02|nr:class I SAM-dependent methyltransferase [Vibrio sonorensis]